MVAELKIAYETVGYDLWREDRVSEAVADYVAANQRSADDRARDLWAFVAERFPSEIEASVAGKHLYWASAYPDFGKEHGLHGRNLFALAVGSEAGLCTIKAYLGGLDIATALNPRVLNNPKTADRTPTRGGGYGCGK